MKKTMIGVGVTLGLAGATYLLMNKKTRKKAEYMLENALDDASSYFNSENKKL